MASVAEEASAWFFEKYFAAYVGSLNGSCEGAAAPLADDWLLDYWNVPMRLSAPGLAAWFLTAEDLVGFHRDVDRAQARSQGFAETVVLDHKVVAYHPDAAGFDAVFSRRRADGSEIGRFAAHYELGRDARGWRIFSLHTAPTEARTLAEAWTA
ncbi:hypothetical protein [Segniliparus rugosus]|uniref:DUF6841 domain-containing protein n=1 Tax=Segniliparus rugosus (strain ATCC BAA-974 / DSM 45345 / CCUG 50838 / CIP 108380 / JCM 13579 / CDC 945) TaxID=679197 RepID=E5XQ67_SEGRC|nr:hypothetical protein [Segniliparus rugosus]EFV13500.1 hypothetical protein HMPREF9336_01639 [Segniliparus rugosus ATCC BAA-974]